MSRRRALTPFSLSFLDIMFCGFGAVVLLVLILSQNVVASREAQYDDLRGEVARLETEAAIGRRRLADTRERLEAAAAERDALTDAANRADRTTQDLERQIAQSAQTRGDARERIERLKADLKKLDKKNQTLKTQRRAEQQAADQRLRAIQGDGDRQYLTGLRMGGKRVLLLIDASASMLDETIVNVVRRKHMTDAHKKAAPKWQRALGIADWLVAHLRGDQFQLYTFNTVTLAAAPGATGRWLNTADPAHINAALDGLDQTIPSGGTSLHQAFEAAAALSPPPDNILLLTDGLPTQGAAKPRDTTVSAEQRLAHFHAAVQRLPPRVPVNAILLPMEGDAQAAAAFWKLAIDTRGSFMTPTRDWP